MRFGVALSAFVITASTLVAQQDVQIQTVAVGPGVHMLIGQGGNIGVSSGTDGVFVIDDQYAPLTEKIVAAIRGFSDEPIRFVVNTHWHGDHVGGNENMGKMGALIVAHDNVRQRMSVEQVMEALGRTVPPSPEEALPVVTFNETVTFHLNGDELHVFHVPHAHTDGDAIIHFRGANVIHMGDTFFNGTYPFIDIGSGGDVNGMIAAADQVLAIADDETKIIPGHGALATRGNLERFRAVLALARTRVAAAIADGSTLDEIKAANLMADHDEAWGQAFINPERFVEFVYQSLQREHH
jgi:glyoxylase-like metal-dependent hydrolase (beta-lactamase superfamily II)